MVFFVFITETEKMDDQPQDLSMKRRKVDDEQDGESKVKRLLTNSCSVPRLPYDYYTNLKQEGSSAISPNPYHPGNYAKIPCNTTDENSPKLEMSIPSAIDLTCETNSLNSNLNSHTLSPISHYAPPRILPAAISPETGPITMNNNLRREISSPISSSSSSSPQSWSPQDYEKFSKFSLLAERSLGFNDNIENRNMSASSRLIHDLYLRAALPHHPMIPYQPAASAFPHVARYYPDSINLPNFMLHQQRDSFLQQGLNSHTNVSSPGSTSSDDSVDSGVGAESNSDDDVDVLAIDDDNKNICNTCKRQFSTVLALMQHQQGTCKKKTPKEQSHGCPHCSKSYTSSGALKMHIKTHTLPCKCHICGKSFSRPWLLQGHIRTHTGEKPFKCSKCERCFADRSNLRAHHQTHTDVKKYPCGKCSKTFSRMSLLVKHMSSHENGQKFPNFTLNDASNLEELKIPEVSSH